MSVFESQLNPQSEEFQTNAEQMTAGVDEFRGIPVTFWPLFWTSAAKQKSVKSTPTLSESGGYKEVKHEQTNDQ